MLTDETRAVLLEALELLRQRAGYHEYLDSGDHRFTPDAAKNAAIDDAIAEVNAEAEWVPVLEDYWGSINVERNGTVITVCESSAIERESDYLIYALPDNVRIFQRTGSQSEAQDE